MLEANKMSKPLMEKKRRARINHSLEELKTLLEKHYSYNVRKRKLEKADILELTVKHIENLLSMRPEGMAPVDQEGISEYTEGFHGCLTKLGSYILRTKTSQQKLKLVDHLNGLHPQSQDGHIHNGLHPQSQDGHNGLHPPSQDGHIHNGLHPQSQDGHIHNGLHPQSQDGHIHNGLHPQSQDGHIHNGLHPHSQDGHNGRVPTSSEKVTQPGYQSIMENGGRQRKPSAGNTTRRGQLVSTQHIDVTPPSPSCPNNLNPPNTCWRPW